MRAWLLLALVTTTGCFFGGDAPDGGHGACTGLSLHDCRLTAGCAADECLLCTCTPVYEGCRAAGDTPYMCPAVECAQPPCCGADGACDVFTCFPPGVSPGCGVCNPAPGDCTGDGDCTGGQICQPIECSCTSATACVPGCVNAVDCGEAERCDAATHRCAPATCDAATPCPADFTCTAGACARATCTADRDCDHYCVAGQCYGGYGQCQAPPP
jgi:hypothetical protein